MSNCDVIILAAGVSARAGADKMLYPLLEDTVIERAVQAFLPLPFVDRAIIAANKYNQAQIKKLFKDCALKPIEIVLGGSTRHLSVKAAMQKVSAPYVLIHDGARPFVSSALIQDVYKCACKKGSAIPVLPVTDSIRKIDDSKIIDKLDRENFVFVQTPQGFDSAKLRQAFVLAARTDYTDESELYAEQIEKPAIVTGSETNYKITSLQDLISARVKVGIGWDLHKLKQGIPLVICGVKVPYNKGLDAHSDGDIAIHAIIDALLSASGLPDIGYFFPDTDAAYAGADSMELLAIAYNKVKALNKKINNLSVLIIADKPKLLPYADQMKERLCLALNIKKEQIALHFKTSEGQFSSMQSWAICTML